MKFIQELSRNTKSRIAFLLCQKHKYRQHFEEPYIL